MKVLMVGNGIINNTDCLQWLRYSPAISIAICSLLLGIDIEDIHKL